MSADVPTLPAMPISVLDPAARTALRRRVRRRVLRHRRPLAALFLAVAVVSGLRVVAPPAPATVPLVVAARDLPHGVVLRADDLETIRVPATVVPDGAAQRGALLGRTLAGPVRRGETLTDARIVSAPLLDGYPGLDAVPVRLADPGAVDLLRPGDRIDLIATDPSSGESSALATRAPVIAIPLPSTASDGLAAQAPSGALIVIGANPTNAHDIAGAGASMYLSAVISR